MRYLLWLGLMLWGLPLIVYSADPADLAQLNQFKQKTAPILDLSGADLRHYQFIPGKVNLQNANLSHANLAGVDLTKMNLQGADLRYADLTNARLNTANLAYANLDHAKLAGAQMHAANLAHADLTCADLSGADLSKANFAAANISGASFVNTITAEVTGYDSIIDRKTICTAESS